MGDAVDPGTPTRRPARMAVDTKAPGQAPPDLPSLLLDGRICYIGMPLVPSVTELVISELLWLNYSAPEKPVYVYINSTGGCCWGRGHSAAGGRGSSAAGGCRVGWGSGREAMQRGGGEAVGRGGAEGGGPGQSVAWGVQVGTRVCSGLWWVQGGLGRG